MSFALLTEDEARQRAQTLIQSRDYWVIPWISGIAGDVCVAMETKFYDGEKNADFELLTLAHPGCFAIAFAHKRHMPREEVAKLVGYPGDIPEKLDVLICMEPGNEERIGTNIQSFLNWVGLP